MFLSLLAMSLQLQADISVTGFTINERDTTVKMFEITRGNEDGQPQTIQIDYSTVDGTAQSVGTPATDDDTYDYVPVNATNVDIDKGETIMVVVPADQDLTIETTEDLELAGHRICSGRCRRATGYHRIWACHGLY